MRSPGAGGWGAGGRRARSTPAAATRPAAGWNGEGWQGFRGPTRRGTVASRGRSTTHPGADTRQTWEGIYSMGQHFPFCHVFSLELGNALFASNNGLTCRCGSVPAPPSAPGLPRGGSSGTTGGTATTCTCTPPPPPAPQPAGPTPPPALCAHRLARQRVSSRSTPGERMPCRSCEAMDRPLLLASSVRAWGWDMRRRAGMLRAG